MRLLLLILSLVVSLGLYGQHHKSLVFDEMLSQYLYLMDCESNVDSLFCGYDFFGTPPKSEPEGDLIFDFIRVYQLIQCGDFDSAEESLDLLEARSKAYLFDYGEKDDLRAEDALFMAHKYLEAIYRVRKGDRSPIAPLEEIFEGFKSEKAGEMRAIFLVDIARELRRNGNFQEALLKLKEAEELRGGVKNIGFNIPFFVQNELATTHRLLSANTSAIKNHKDYLNKMYNGEREFEIIDGHLELSQDYLSIGMNDLALSHLDTALSESSSYNLSCQAQIQFQYGDYYFEQQQLDSAVYYFTKSISNPTHFLSPRLIASCNLKLADSFFKVRSINTSKDHLDLLSSDSLLKHLSLEEKIRYYTLVIDVSKSLGISVYEDVQEALSEAKKKHSVGLRNGINTLNEIEKRGLTAIQDTISSLEENRRQKDDDIDYISSQNEGLHIAYFFLSIFCISIFIVFFFELKKAKEKGEHEMSSDEIKSGAALKNEPLIMPKIQVLELKSGQEIPLRQIICIKKKNNAYLRVFYKDDKDKWGYEREKNTLKEIIKQLPPNHFVKTERSHIVNLDYYKGSVVKVGRQKFLLLSVDLSALDSNLNGRIPLTNDDELQEAFEAYKKARQHAGKA